MTRTENSRITLTIECLGSTPTDIRNMLVSMMDEILENFEIDQNSVVSMNELTEGTEDVVLSIAVNYTEKELRDHWDHIRFDVDACLEIEAHLITEITGVTFC